MPHPHKTKRLWALVSVFVLPLCCLLLFYFFLANNTRKALAFECTYALDVQLDTTSLNYQEQACIHNLGSSHTRELYFHLYANRELDDGEKIEILSLCDESGAELPFEVLNGGQLIRVRLKKPLGANETAVLLFQCEARLSEMKESFGIARDGDIRIPEFPVQLAVYDENGWDKDPSCDNGDGRYSAVADYSLKVSVPAGYDLICTGEELDRRQEGASDTYWFQANGRRDIVLAMHTDYRKMERVVGQTTVIGCFTENVTETVAQRAMDEAAFALNFYNTVYMQYPYDTLILMNAPWSNHFEANKEYSGFITVAMGDDLPLDALYHEVAHQWFYFLVGNDENKEAWLDESLATFSQNLCLEAAGDDASGWWKYYKAISDRYPGQAVNVLSDRISDYSPVIYNRGANFLKELQDAMGQDALLSALSDYCVQYAGRVATTQDFLQILSSHATTDLRSLIEEYIQ